MIQFFKLKQKNSAIHNQSGQTMLIALFAIIVLLLSALFIFDLQSVIRVKIKSQTAADSAALAAASIQKESINLIGELNLIKASTVLITDFANNDRSSEALMQASDNLTQMQARIGFAGPMLALGAAQQAAKNNGMVDPNTVCTRDDYNVFSLSSYIENVKDDDIYGSDDYPDTIQGYEWREPYIKMLNMINNQGIAAGPNMLSPHIDSNYTLDLINAVLYEFWCQTDLKNIIKNDDNFQEQWWNGLVADAGFARESEVLPLHISLTGNDPSGHTYSSAVEKAYEFIQRLAEDRNLTIGMITQMPYMKWCLYDATWDYNTPKQWSENYLRRPLRKEYLYGGAAAKITCLIPGGENSKFKWLSGGYQIHNIHNKEGIISSKQSATPDLRSSAVAKPFGFIESESGEKLSPTSASIILPAFKIVRLVPVAMLNLTSIYDEQFLFYKFLKWLEGVGNIENPTTPPPAGTEKYLIAFQRLNDPLWRHKGYNPAFSYTPPGYAPSYDPASDTGAGWLQRPASDPNISETTNDGYERDSDGNIIGIAFTNEDLCDWTPSGDGGNNGGGGPGELH
jgi:hypothetical protein